MIDVKRRTLREECRQLQWDSNSSGEFDAIKWFPSGVEIEKIDAAMREAALKHDFILGSICITRMTRGGSIEKHVHESSRILVYLQRSEIVLNGELTIIDAYTPFWLKKGVVHSVPEPKRQRYAFVGLSITQCL